MVRSFDIPNNGQTRMELLPKVGLNNLAMWRALTFFWKKCIRAIEQPSVRVVQTALGSYSTINPVKRIQVDILQTVDQL